MAVTQSGRRPGAPLPTSPPDGSTGPKPANDEPADSSAWLAMLQHELVPRLMLMHGQANIPNVAGPAAIGAPPIGPAAVGQLAVLATEADGALARQYVARLVEQGAPIESVLLNLLTPTARLLGQWWVADTMSFAQVTLGLWRLQQVLHDYSAGFRATGLWPAAGARILLSTEPGSQHTFGVSMLGEFFSRDGWDVHLALQSSWGELSALLSEQHFDVLGLSIGVDGAIASTASAILQLREASRVPDLMVMVGGPAALNVSDLAERCGADAMASHATTALRLANQWVQSRRRASA